MIDSVFFIVGPHGVGKTFNVNKIKEKIDVKHIDLGPLIREAHMKFSPNISLEEWIAEGEKKYGANFTDIILCKQIEREIEKDSRERTILITGSRSLGGIEYIAKNFSIKNPQIIYITAPFLQLKQNYERREKKKLTDAEFMEVIENEKRMGLEQLENYAMHNDKCMYIYNDNTERFTEKLLKVISQENIKDRKEENMRNKLIYLTTNPHKVEEANEFFGKKYGFNIEIVNPDFEILEIQAKTCAEVAAFSAKYAADKLGYPVLKSDSGLYLEALGGLPGPYNAYFDKQIGIEKFLKMMESEENRNARLEHCFAYCEPSQEPVVFASGSTGIISKIPRGDRGRWHDKFYIPDGEEKTLSELREIDYEYEASFWGDAKDQFARWYKTNKLNGKRIEDDIER